MNEAKAPLLCVVGPTASGKSTLAARLAQKLGGEVISADSVQVYRHFDIGAGKPSPEELALAPHHLIGVRDPLDPLEANVWASMAAETVEEIRKRGALPIVCGGTFLWVRALLFGLADAPPGDAAIRRRHEEQAQSEGRESLHRRLSEVDPKSAARLHPNDFVRVSRALEVQELTGRPLSEIQEAHGFRESRYRARLLSVDWAPEEYEERVLRRVRQMMKDGFAKEVTDLLARGYGEARAMDAVGYRQVREALAAETVWDEEEVIAQVVRVTRVFARRQRTWLREQPVEKVSSLVFESEEKLESLAEDVRRFYSAPELT